jgi:DNA-binding response OmpR family regulator
VASPIIIVTALDDTDSRIVAFGAGANDYIVKPFHINELTSKLQALIKK